MVVCKTRKQDSPSPSQHPNREIREGDGDVGDRYRDIREGTEELVVRTS